LPAEDLADISPLSSMADKRRKLNKLLGPVTLTYGAVRHYEDTLWGLEPALPLEVAPPTLEQVLAAIAKRAHRGKETDSCLEVAKLFKAFMDAEGFKAVEADLGPLQLGVGLWANFCSGVVLSKPGEPPIVAAVNYRRSGYTPAALRFAFSAMHEQSRALHRDLRDARLGLLHFPQPPKRKPRWAAMSFADATELFTYEQLSRMAAETYALWEEVQREAVEAVRRTGTDDDWWDGDR